MPLSAARRVIPPKWCPSCSLALFRAFASVCGTTFPAPTRRIGRNGYRHLSYLTSKGGLKVYRDSRSIERYAGVINARRSYIPEPGSDEELGRIVDEMEAKKAEKEKEEDFEQDGLKALMEELEEIEKSGSFEQKMERIEANTMADMVDALKNEASAGIDWERDAEGEETKARILENLEKLIKSGAARRAARSSEQESTNETLDSKPMGLEAESITAQTEPISKLLTEDTTVGESSTQEFPRNINVTGFEDGVIDKNANEAEIMDPEIIQEQAEYLMAEDMDSNEEVDIEEVEGMEEAEFRLEEEEDIEYRSAEPPATEPATEGTPWYLQSPLEPAPRRFVSPLIEQMPELPQNSPENFETLLNYLIKDLSLSKIKIMDLRGLEPTPALGPNVIMVLATARSERHMNIAADKCCRYMRGILAGTHIYADGLIGRGEIKLRERRERRKGKRRTAEDDEAMKVGWICINSGQGIVVQVMTGWKREQLNLEGLWSRKIHTSKKRKMKDELLAQGVSEEEIKSRIAEELPEKVALEEAPEYDAEEDAIEARKVEEKLIVSEILPPLDDPSRVGLEEFQDVLKTVEIHSKSKKKPEGKRYIDIPAVKQRKLTWREKRKQLEGVSFSTKDPFSKNARQFSTLVETPQTSDLFSMIGQLPLVELSPEDLVKKGRYREVLKLYPRPRTDKQATLVLLAHLNHLLVTPPEIAATTLLSPNPDQLYETPFFKSFKLSFPKRPSPTHNHIHALLHLSAHNISPLLYSIKKYTRLPAEIMQAGNQVPLVTYHILLRALATSPSLRGDQARSLSFWTNRTSDILSTMTLLLLRKMDASGIEVGHDPEVFESLWLAMAPADTLDYVSTLGDPKLRSSEIRPDEPFSRALDHRLDLYKQFHKLWYDPFRFLPQESTYFRGPAVEEDVLGNLLHSSLRYPPEHPRGRYDILPSYLVTMLVSTARARRWGWMKEFWRWLPGKGVRRPKALYALYLELMAREAATHIVIEGLRYMLSDYETEYTAGRDEVSDGIAEALLACIEFIEEEVPGTGQEFGRWKRRSEAFLSGGKVTEDQGNYTYVI